MDQYLEDAVKAAKETGELLRNMVAKVDYDQISDEGRDAFVDEADVKSLDCLYESLHKAYPDYEFFSLANEDPTIKKEGLLWMLDPLVGTTNFAYGIPYYAISVALFLDGAVILGVIYDPVADELFTAIKGQGTFLNGKQVHVSETKDLKRAFLSQRFPYDLNDGGVTNLGLFNHVIKNCKGIHSANSATMDLAWVAAGRLDGFWSLRLNPWDLAAGVLLVEEAGGKVSTLSGDPYFIDSEELVAANSNIFGKFIETIGEVPRESW